MLLVATEHQHRAHAVSLSLNSNRRRAAAGTHDGCVRACVLLCFVPAALHTHSAVLCVYVSILLPADSAAGLPTSSEGIHECGLLVGKGKVRGMVVVVVHAALPALSDLCCISRKDRLL